MANVEYHVMSGATLLYKVAAAYPNTDASGNFGFLWSTDASKPDNSPPAPSCVVYLGTGLSIVEATDAPIPAPVAVAPEWPEWMVTNNLQPVATVYANTDEMGDSPGIRDRRYRSLTLPRPQQNQRHQPGHCLHA